uniref:hypothetical protein n=1 Tax=Streptomyces longwoodensis TaxID=68231 RepID=UPI002F90C7EE
MDWHPEGGYHSYDRSIPIVATTLQELREHGPAGPAFWRFGREDRQPLLGAIGNARRDAYLTRRRQAARAEQRRRKEREAAQREARRPVCADYGQKFTDDRWEGGRGHGAAEAPAVVVLQGPGQHRQVHEVAADAAPEPGGVRVAQQSGRRRQLAHADGRRGRALPGGVAHAQRPGEARRGDDLGHAQERTGPAEAADESRTTAEFPSGPRAILGSPIGCGTTVGRG